MYEAIGILKQIQPVEKGQTNNGKEWAKQAFCITIPDAKYPKEYAFVAWNKTIAYLENIGEGSDMKITFEPNSREWNGKYFTDLTALKIEVINRAEPAPEKPIENGLGETVLEVSAEIEDKEDLPF